MAAIRHTLQRDVFGPSDERLLAVVHVSKVLKKKKTSFLCVAVSVEKPVIVTVCQVKKTDKNVFKKKNTWQLSELKIVDGKDKGTDTHEFDLQFDKTYRWLASNTQERRNFFIVLWKLCCKYLPKQKPAFMCIPEEITADSDIVGEGEVSSTAGIVDAVESEDYHALTERESSDLEQLMDKCHFAVSNAEAFMELLAKDLSVLDGANVQSVLASEQQVDQLMQKIDVAIEEVEVIEKQLDSYDEALSHIRDAMGKMEEKNAVIGTANRNSQLLLEELDKVIVQLDLPHKHQMALIDADFTTPQGLQDALAAGRALMAAMNAEIHPALVRMAAVQEQRKRFDKWKSKFSQSATRHLNNLFVHMGNDSGETLSFHASELTLPRHGAVHRELTIFAELMHWLKAMDRKAYTALSKVYTSSLSKLYERDLKQFFEEAKQAISGSRDKKGKGSGSSQDLAGKLKHQAQNLGPGLGVGRSPAPVGLLGMDKDQWGSEPTVTERQRFDEVLERALAELEPVCLAEQTFCVQFFQLDVSSPNGKNTQTTLDVLSSPMSETGPPKGQQLPPRRREQQMNEEVRRMMGELFACLEPELLSFISSYEKTDSFCCMYVLVRLSQHVMSAQDTGSFLSKTFGSALVQVKRNFDRFMQAQLKSIEEAKGNKKTKCGILPFVTNFEEFANTAESIFRGSDRRADLDKWYTRLVTAMFEATSRIASEHHKTPSEVVKMENYHHLYALLSQLKVAVLDGLRKEAKQKYSDSLKAYVTRYFGRPLEKLNLFFEGVQAKVAQGVKESEISYQMAFSKQELRKVIKEYPAREVKKGLESLYRKVEKHLCDEENLLQVVWRAMQEEFICQYKSLEDLVLRCYPGSMIMLEFAIDDILTFFSEIARSH